MDDRDRMILENELLLKREQEKRAWYERRSSQADERDREREERENAHNARIRQEAAENEKAARCREEEESEAARVAEADAHSRTLTLSRRQAASLMTCVEALEALAHDSLADDVEKVAESRDHVLRALRANFFQREETPLERLEPVIRDYLPIMMQLAGVGQKPAQSACCGMGMGPAYPPPPPEWDLDRAVHEVAGRPIAGIAAQVLRPGQIVRSTNGDLMRVVRAPDGRLMCEPLQREQAPAEPMEFVGEYPSGGAVYPSSGGVVYPSGEPIEIEPPAVAPAGSGLVAQHWDSIRRLLSDDELDEAIRLAHAEREVRQALANANAGADSYKVAG